MNVSNAIESVVILDSLIVLRAFPNASRSVSKDSSFSLPNPTKINLFTLNLPKVCILTTDFFLEEISPAFTNSVSWPSNRSSASFPIPVNFTGLSNTPRIRHSSIKSIFKEFFTVNILLPPPFYYIHYNEIFKNFRIRSAKIIITRYIV
ncbi:Uncharacterised protein [Chlamydia trachomatis]|nr:Uncharacterised protein [Chlamydia trachomatis]